MLEKVQCPKPAYDKIVESRLDKKILEKREIISSIFLHKSVYLEETEELSNHASKIYLCSKKISEKTRLSKKILDVEKISSENNFFDSDDFEEILMNNSCFLGYVVLGDDLFNFDKYDFPSRKSLEESITSFCIGERDDLFRGNSGNYYWRNGNLKNLISQNMHGDLFACQWDIFGKESIDRTLFGDVEVFDTFKQPERSSGVHAYQDWSQFLVASLKYAEYLGKKDIPEIVSWREVLEELGGGVGTATSEAMFGGTCGDYEVQRLMESPVLNDKESSLEQFPLSIYARGASFLPYIKEDKLIYLEENENGDISLDKFAKIYEGRKFSKCFEYNRNDLVDILKATYKLFARDRGAFCMIMDYFNSQK